MQSSRFGSVQEATRAAEAHGLRQRAVCYLIRGAAEVLVFEHGAHLPDSGVQLPAGGVDIGETPAEAAEETGPPNLSAPVHLGSCEWGGPGWTGPHQVWHSFQLTAPPGTLDAWAHRVTGGVGDTGLLFHLRFTPLAAPDLTPGLGSHEYLPELARLLRASQRQEQP